MIFLIFYDHYLNFRKYSLGGAYRKILEIPSNVSSKIVHYKEKHSDLIKCDIDEMRKLSSPQDDPGRMFNRIFHIDFFNLRLLKKSTKYTLNFQLFRGTVQSFNSRNVSKIVYVCNDGIA